MVSRMEDIHCLWDELVDFGASEIDDALVHFMRQIAKIVDADDVVWVGAVRLASGASARRDPQLGWRVQSARFMNPKPQQISNANRSKREQDTAPALTSIALVKEAGKPRVHRLRDGFVDLDAFKKTEHYQYIHVMTDIRDRMYAVTPIREQAESFFLFDRVGRNKRFSLRDTETVAYALRGLKWFQKELMLANGLNIADKPLSPTERKVIRLLLTEKTEAQIAEALGHSQHTTHGYVKEILKKYGVKGRTGLMALWLSRQG
ncbi:helix-turn-helix transcriptional regulator [Rubellicoccus peritrichatus]|uniref:Helix-turn-helix transcriptional regulator n=1 Tax=Rubellicoccus peritrichatus TaxID=3080537 RepID=A0AAQ3LAI3_9BACT|nr:helix-turn-helix transcriptional regulator [Puniceicoccus sp. CR14]WOO40642.1 helix-turn-helix transcriptional regulator [Puniceicoccus sp. CR14]